MSGYPFRLRDPGGGQDNYLWVLEHVEHDTIQTLLTMDDQPRRNGTSSSKSGPTLDETNHQPTQTRILIR